MADGPQYRGLKVSEPFGNSSLMRFGEGFDVFIGGLEPDIEIPRLKPPTKPAE